MRSSPRTSPGTSSIPAPAWAWDEHQSSQSRNYSVIKLSHCPSRYGAKHSLTIQTSRQTNTRTVEPDANCCLSPPHSKLKMPPDTRTGHRMSVPVVTPWSPGPGAGDEREKHSGSGINHSGLRARNVGQVSPLGRVRLVSSLARTLIHFTRGMSRTPGWWEYVHQTLYHGLWI